MTITATDARTMAEARFTDMSTGDLDAFTRTFHPTASDRIVGAPPACATPGPEGFHAAALWLRGMFSDLRWDVHEAIAQDDLLVAYTTMRGRHTGPMTKYSPDGDLVMDVPATGNEVAVTQTHWYRYLDDLIVEHWASRDDLGMLRQLGLVG
ncbi:ester cyclase [Actinomycetospora lutea]|uniref:ester cyclase n=1 Tax=Actinomycetospora lutea TaxID=663604 RepID=UPI002365A271|nr:ester cyclase [Actinomycetospora lutea]MDD7939049.1 ester cyclase [Actinomycetospora lutea]